MSRPWFVSREQFATKIFCKLLNLLHAVASAFHDEMEMKAKNVQFRGATFNKAKLFSFMSQMEIMKVLKLHSQIPLTVCVGGNLIWLLWAETVPLPNAETACY